MNYTVLKDWDDIESYIWEDLDGFTWNDFFKNHSLSFNYNIFPKYIIDDVSIRGGNGMHFYPEQSVIINFSVKSFEDKLPADPNSFDISLYDPRGVKRVSYDAGRLNQTSVGSYDYGFEIPLDVIVGSWYVKIIMTKLTYKSVITISFDVKER